jgi:saccharopine dehydrogenase (NAD+, L-lysine-forming)
MDSFLIRAEDKNIWERRAPLTPKDVQAIMEATGAAAFVENSDKRFFALEDYLAGGAVACQGLGPGQVVFGVKEIPEEKILPGKVYVFFSHTIKGQKAGMPLLKKIIDSGATLIDYEKITDDRNRRLIYFGRFAGDAGAIDILSLMGEYWNHHGLATPFVDIRRAHQYPCAAAAKAHIRAVGQIIAEQGLPGRLSPLTIGILGYGNVSCGAQQVFDCLPNRRIAPEDLPALIQGGRCDSRIIYTCVFKEQDLVQPKNGDPFDLQQYYRHPQRYESIFARYLPFLTILVNAVYWEARYPRFVTWQDLKALFQAHSKPKLCGIADISCDPQGAMECNVRATDSSMPAYRCDPLGGTTADGHLGDGIVMLAVDNLPCELPGDASTFFSHQLKPLAVSIVSAHFDRPLEDSGLCPEVQKAVIVYQGKLTPRYEYLKAYLEKID